MNKNSRKINQSMIIEERMEIFANFMLDRILEDKKSGKLDRLIKEGKIKSSSD